MTLTEGFALAGAAAAAGLINAVAGGGTLITFPVLLAFGVPPVVANATNTVSLMAGTLGSVFGFRRHMAPIRGWLWRFVPVSIAGGAAGSWLLTHTTDRVFGRLVPFLILFATVVFLLQGVFRRFTQPDVTGPADARSTHVWAAIVFQFGVALYGGYFGAGIGILMLASLGMLGLTHIHEMNALKTVLSSLINLVASVLFIAAGLIDWPRALLMTAGAVVGYYVGSHYSQRFSPAHLRRFITAIGLGMSGWTFYREFVR